MSEKTKPKKGDRRTYKDRQEYQREYQRNYRKSNPDKIVRSKHSKEYINKYRRDRRAKEKLIASGGKCCSVCGKTFTQRQLNSVVIQKIGAHSTCKPTEYRRTYQYWKKWGELP